MIVSKKFLTDHRGNVILSVVEDQEEYAKNVQDIRETTGGWTEERTMKLIARIPPREFHKWGEQLGYDCWSDRDFLRFFRQHRPDLFV